MAWIDSKQFGSTDNTQNIWITLTFVSFTVRLETELYNKCSIEVHSFVSLGSNATQCSCSTPSTTYRTCIQHKKTPETSSADSKADKTLSVRIHIITT